MRLASYLLLFVGIAATSLAACSHSIPPGGRPSLPEDMGIAVLVIDTDTPLSRIHFNRADEFEGFTIDFADAGRSVHLVKLVADRYRLSDFDLPDEEFNPEGGAQLCLLVEPGQMTYPGHFVFRKGGEKDGFKTYTNWQWTQDFEDMKRRVTIEWTDLLAEYPVKSASCP